jgi:hypothetical protein
MIKTYLDYGVLIAAARGTDATSLKAIFRFLIASNPFRENSLRFS